MQTWKNLLKNLGFGESESKIYLISLEVGPKSVQDLAKIAGISRMTTYSVIETLNTKGLMSSVQKGKKTLFTAESPNRLLAFLKKNIQKMESTLKEVEETIQELSQLQSKDKPSVKMFEGNEALSVIQSDLLASKPHSVFEFGNFDDLLKIYSFESELSDTHKKLDKLKMPRNVIYATNSVIPQSKDSSIKRVVISPQEFDFHGDILVYNNKVALSCLKDKHTSVIIENEEIAKTMRALFNLFWSKK